ncbi:ThuA domain-containing protein, partial [Halalkalibaculum sp. DA3122]|uniref:ThuA domain-containing protein n=2 Tax=unclassified Halalkalibaculum TaxID=2964617 RepID=UPI00375475F4
DSLRVLVFSGTGWYRHAEIPLINGWLVRLGAAHQMRVDVTETPSDISEESLRAYDVLLINNANELDQVFSQQQRAAIRQWYQAGGGIVGLHAALVRQQGWEWFSELGGCDFESDSNYQRAKVMVDPQARDHPAVEGYGPEFWYSADWHNHTRPVTGLEGVQVLLRVDESTYEPVRDYFLEQGATPMGEDHPVSWTRQYDGSRFFYTELGHDLRSLDTEFGRMHILEAIRWVAKSTSEE